MRFESTEGGAVVDTFEGDEGGENEYKGKKKSEDKDGVENLFGELRGRNHDEVALPHAEEEDVTEFFGEIGEVAVVEVVADLEPVAEDWDGEWARWELEFPAAEGGDGDGDHRSEEETYEGLFQKEEIHCRRIVAS